MLLQVEKSNSTPNSIRVFKDGKIDFESELDWFKFNGTNFHLRIGHLPKMGDYYRGLIDDVRVYDRILSKTEVQALYGMSQASK